MARAGPPLDKNRPKCSRYTSKLTESDDNREASKNFS